MIRLFFYDDQDVFFGFVFDGSAENCFVRGFIRLIELHSYGIVKTI